MLLNHFYLRVKYAFCILPVLALVCSQTFAQKTITLENYHRESRNATSKISQQFSQLQQQTSLSSARKANSDIKSHEDFLHPNLMPVYDGYVVIEAVAENNKSQKLLRDLEKLGLKRSSQFEHTVSGLFPLDKIGELENVSTLRYAQPVARPMTRAGAVTSRGDIVLKAEKARRIYGLSGEGVKIGILSDSYDNLAGEADGIASGDLPEEGVSVLEDLPEGGIDEGRAMAEIIHDLAPDAELFFHTAFLGQPSFAQGILDLQEAGCNVIVDDVGYLTSPFFQDGIIAQAVDQVQNKGAAYFSAAGNSGNQSYENSFNNLGFKLVDEDGFELGFAHDFSGGDIYQRFVIPAVSPSGFESSLVLSLQWDDPAFSASGEKGAQTDLDYYFILPQYDLVIPFVEPNIGFDPIEWGGIINPTDEDLIVDVLIVKYEGPDPGLIKYINFGEAVPMEYDTQSSTIYGHSNATGAMAVGATAWFNTPEFNPNLEKPAINGFSSKGGTPILFKKNGDRQSSPKIRNKPEFVAADGVNTTFFLADLSFNVPGTDEPDGFPNFFGTSASAPHAAAIGALLLEASLGSLAPEDMERSLKRSAIDMDDPDTEEFDKGFDFRTGRGFIQADKAVREVYKLPFPQNPLIPLAEYVEYDHELDAFKAYFGYENTNNTPLLIPVGEDNRFLPDEKNVGQVTQFAPGRVKKAFYVILEAGEFATWALKGPDSKVRTATARAPSSTEDVLPSARINLEEKETMLSSPQARIYPNISSGQVSLEAIASSPEKISISIHDKLGNIVYQTEGIESIKETKNFENLQKGVYLVSFRFGETIENQKLIIH